MDGSVDEQADRVAGIWAIADYLQPVVDAWLSSDGGRPAPDGVASHGILDGTGGGAGLTSMIGPQLDSVTTTLPDVSAASLGRAAGASRPGSLSMACASGP